MSTRTTLCLIVGTACLALTGVGFINSTVDQTQASGSMWVCGGLAAIFLLVGGAFGIFDSVKSDASSKQADGHLPPAGQGAQTPDVETRDLPFQRRVRAAVKNGPGLSPEEEEELRRNIKADIELGRFSH